MNTPGIPQRRNTQDYRFQLTRDVLTTLHRGDCAALVGVGSCGKSRLLNHLSRPDVMQYHLGPSAFDHMLVLTECNAWVSETVWAAYEGITRSLMDLLNTSPHPIIRAKQRDLAGMYEAVAAERDLALKHVMTGLQYLLANSPLKLTICFDEFDFVFEKFEAPLFRNLRALRNQHKYQLTYLVATRKQLPYQRARETWPEVEEFYELFADNTFAIGPFDDRDATEMVVDLENRFSFPLNQITRGLLIGVTGGHSGLLGASFRLLEASRRQPTTPQEMGQMVLTDQSTWKECRRIWDSLRTEEQAVLRRMAQGTRLQRGDEVLQAELRAKGLVRELQNHAQVIFSAIFNEYARTTTD